MTQPDGAVQANGGVVPADPSAPLGPGAVITDDAGQTEPAPVPSDGAVDPSPPKRGEVHVLDTATASSPPPPAANTSAVPAAAAAPVATPRRTTAAPARATLPFTGVNAGLIALIGAAMLATGLAVARVAGPAPR